MKVETVRIKSRDKFIVINESDFDPKKHVLFSEVIKAKIEIEKKDDLKKKKQPGREKRLREHAKKHFDLAFPKNTPIEDIEQQLKDLEFGPVKRK